MEDSSGGLFVRIQYDKQCDACGFLKNPSPETQILDTILEWGIDGTTTPIFGRAYVTLKEHKANLSSLAKTSGQIFKRL